MKRRKVMAVAGVGTSAGLGWAAGLAGFRADAGRIARMVTPGNSRADRKGPLADGFC